MVIKNIAQASLAVSTALKSYMDYLAGEKEHRTTWNDNVRSRRFTMLGSIYPVCLELAANPELLAKLCVQENVQVPDSSENPFAAAIRLVCRTKDQKGNWIAASKSTWIYSKYFRAAQHLGWGSDEFADKVAAYEFQHGAKKIKWLSGLAALHDKEFGKGDVAMDERVESAARSWMTYGYSGSLASFPILAGVDDPDDGQMVGIVAQWDADARQWLVRAANEANSDKAFALVSKNIVGQFNDWRDRKSLEQAEEDLAVNPVLSDDELLEAVARQHREQGEANDAAYADNSQRLTVHTQSEGSVISETREVTIPKDAPADEQPGEASQQVSGQ